MGEIVDARGLSCPQPVLKTLEGLKRLGKGEMMVIVDTETSRENVIRAAGAQGWQVKDILVELGEYRIALEKA